MMARAWLAAALLALAAACSSASGDDPASSGSAASSQPGALPAEPGSSLSVATLTVEGMVCQSCAETVAGALEDVGGVRSAEVDSETKTATVRYDASETEISRLVAAVEGLQRDPAPPFRVTDSTVSP